MEELPSLVESIRAIAGELRLEPRTPIRLNQIAAELDQLGRRLHGQGWPSEHEIGVALTAAVRALGEARDEPERERAGSVWRALAQLEAALACLETSCSDGRRSDTLGQRGEVLPGRNAAS
jgi:hypothetical protein